MNAGSGNRKYAYFRITKDKFGAFNKKGVFDTKPENTHFDINPDTCLKDIKDVLDKINKSKN